VLDIGRLAGKADKHRPVRKDVQAELTTAQSMLRKLSPAPPHAQDVITAIGFLRLGLDSNSYRPTLLTDVIVAQRALQQACVAANAQ
jgi:hypothetical protein